MDLHATTNQQIVCNFDENQAKTVGMTKNYKPNKRIQKTRGAINSVNLAKQVAFGAWKPTPHRPEGTLDTLAVTYRSCIYLYQTK